MTDRTYTFTFGGDDMHVESSDGLLGEQDAANILYWFATEIKPHAPLAALSELHHAVQGEIVNQREVEA